MAYNMIYVCVNMFIQAQLEAEEAERLKEIEDEKRRKAEAYREKKRMEKQVDDTSF